MAISETCGHGLQCSSVYYTQQLLCFLNAADVHDE